MQQVVFDPRLKCLRMLDREEIIQSGGVINLPNPEAHVSFQPLTGTTPGKQRNFEKHQEQFERNQQYQLDRAQHIHNQAIKSNKGLRGGIVGHRFRNQGPNKQKTQPPTNLKEIARPDALQLELKKISDFQKAMRPLEA